MGNRPIQNSDCLVRQEQQALWNWRIHRGREHELWTGIALSGGGIRSATFCLGVLQALANRDHLKHFDYMSTVSGGGYTGCSLQWWWYQPDPISHALPQDKNSNNTSLHGELEGELGTTKSNFPFGTSEPGPSHSPRDDIHKNARLNNLRHHGNYLAPGRLINYFSLLGAILRAIILNLLVWIPLIGFIFYAFYMFDLPLKTLWNHLSIVDRAFEPWLPPETPILYQILLLAAGGVVMFFILACAFYSLQTWDSQEGKRQRWDFAKASLLFAAMLASIVAFFLVSKSSQSDFEIFQILGVKPDIHIVLLSLLLVVALVIAALLWKTTALIAKSGFRPSAAYVAGRSLLSGAGSTLPPDDRRYPAPTGIAGALGSAEVERLNRLYENYLKAGRLCLEGRGYVTSR
jgi:hypothetical protein